MLFQSEYYYCDIRFQIITFFTNRHKTACIQLELFHCLHRSFEVLIIPRIARTLTERKRYTSFVPAGLI